MLHPSEILRPKTKIPALEMLHDFFLIRPGNTTVRCWSFPVIVNIEILFFNVYINRETSAPDEKHFPPLDTLSSQLILSSSRKKKFARINQKQPEIWKYFRTCCRLKSTPSIESKKTHIRILHLKLHSAQIFRSRSFPQCQKMQLNLRYWRVKQIFVECFYW